MAKVSNKQGRLPQILGIAVIVIAAALALPALTASVWTPNCESCHQNQTTTQAEGAHRSLACKRCHQAGGTIERLAMSQRVMYGMVLQVIPLGDATVAVSNQVCESCHQSLVSDQQVEANGLRISHATCAKELQCVSCHGVTAHEVAAPWMKTISMEQCVRCHGQKQVFTAQCESCHIGSVTPQSPQVTTLSESASLDRVSSDEQTDQESAQVGVTSIFSMTHGADWKEKHGLGDTTTCASCHKTEDCRSCHGPLVPHDSYIIAQHGSAATAAGGNKCGTCHKDTKMCDSCHGLPMPHPKGFLKAHSSRIQQGALSRELCLNCHKETDCSNCHAGHAHPGGAR
ncbi:MAG: hypothetical protein LBJ07_04260 [Actinomycetes bacterium]|nr:hypothetical protein [Actinomycetes bacterium]